MQKIKLKQIQFDGSSTQYVKGDGSLGNTNELVSNSFTFVLSVNDLEELTCDTTIFDIINAYNNNKIIIAKIIENTSSYRSYNIVIGDNQVIASFNIPLFGNLVIKGLYSNNTDVWSVIDYSLSLSVNDKNKLNSINKYGTSVSLSINPTTYVLTLQLLDQDGNNLGAAQTIDLPLESIVTAAQYYHSYTYNGIVYNKVIVMTLSTTDVPVIIPVAGLVSGLQPAITQNNKLSADLVTNGIENRVFTALEQNKLASIDVGVADKIRLNEHCYLISGFDSDIPPGSLVALDHHNLLMPVIVSDYKEPPRWAINPFLQFYIVAKNIASGGYIEGKNLSTQTIVYVRGSWIYPLSKNSDNVYLVTTLPDASGNVNIIGISQDLNHDIAEDRLYILLGIGINEVSFYLHETHPIYFLDGNGNIALYGGVTKLGDITDLALSSPKDGDILMFHNGQWENVPYRDLTNYDFTELSAPKISNGATTITFNANQRNIVEFSTDADLSIAIISNNKADNYILVTNLAKEDIHIVFDRIFYGATNIKSIGTDSPLKIPPGATIEICIYVTDKAIITSKLLD